jgi:hypothetical protein
MFLVDLEQVLPRQTAQPGVEGNSAVAEIVVQLLARLEEGLLHDIGRINTGGDARVQTHADHALQPIAVSCQQLASRGAIACGSPLHKGLGVRRRGEHELSSYLRLAKAEEKVTGILKERREKLIWSKVEQLTNF